MALFSDEVALQFSKVESHCCRYSHSNARDTFHFHLQECFLGITQGLTCKNICLPHVPKVLLQGSSTWESLIRKKTSPEGLIFYYRRNEGKKVRGGSSGEEHIDGEMIGIPGFPFYTTQTEDTKWERMSFVIGCQWDYDAWFDHSVLKSLITYQKTYTYTFEALIWKCMHFN